jgi:hypothetical protein
LLLVCRNVLCRVAAVVRDCQPMSTRNAVSARCALCLPILLLLYPFTLQLLPLQEDDHSVQG